MDILSNFAERLEELIFESHSSIKSFSLDINISVPTINRYLNQRRLPKVKTLILFSDYFKVSCDYILGKTENNYKSQFQTYEPFSARFERILKHTDTTRYFLNKVSHISEHSLCDWVKGKHTPSVENVVKLADFFDLTVDEMLGRSVLTYGSR